MERERERERKKMREEAVRVCCAVQINSLPHGLEPFGHVSRKPVQHLLRAVVRHKHIAHPHNENRRSGPALALQHQHRSNDRNVLTFTPLVHTNPHTHTRTHSHTHSHTHTHTHTHTYTAYVPVNVYTSRRHSIVFNTDSSTTKALRSASLCFSICLDGKRKAQS